MFIKPEVENFARIKVIGVGGGGSNAIKTMMEIHNIQGVDFIAINTDAQHLGMSPAPTKVQIGRDLTQGLGAGGDPAVGQKSAQENKEELQQLLKGADLVFITAGMGGGTGSGASPVIADVAKGVGALTIGVVTKPFDFEGAKRRLNADESTGNLKDRVDALITIPNQRLLEIAEKNITLLGAFRMADSVLGDSVKGISDIIVMPGLINRDFADVRSIMHNAGSALMGIGKAQGEGRALAAAKLAIESPLLESSIAGAKGVLFNISGGDDLTLAEVNEAANLIASAADPNANIIFGATIDNSLSESVKITVIATGFDENALRFREFQKPQDLQKIKPESISKEDPDLLTKEESDSDLPAFMRRR